MNILSDFHFASISDSDASPSRSTTRTWYTLLDWASTPSMHDTTNFFWYQGFPPIKYWSESKTMFACFTDFSITLIGDTFTTNAYLTPVYPL